MASSCRSSVVFAQALMLGWCIQSMTVPAARAQVPAQAPQSAPQAAPVGPRSFPVDPRVQVRTYHFAEANKDMPYALFVSSKVRPDRKAPLIVMLHGLGVPETFMLRAPALDLAEQGGYILVGPLGYNIRGWYGVPPFRRPAGAPPPRAIPGLGPQPNDPPNLRELSEKDVMNVLALVRKEFNVDDRRIYLMGHSMGGAGTFHIAVKYPKYWAAIAVMAPAAFGMDPQSIASIPQTPVLVVHGDADNLVPIAISRSWVDVMKAQHMRYEFDEIPGATHGTVIAIGMPKVFAFFDEHPKPSAH